MPGPGQRISTSILAVQTGILGRGRRPQDYTVAGQGSRVPSVVSFGTHANASRVQFVLLADMPRDDLAKPRSLAISNPAISKPAISKPAISKTDGAVDNCAPPSVRWAACFEPYRDEMHSNEIADRATLANRSRDFMQKHLNRRID